MIKDKLYYTCYFDFWVKGINAEARLSNVKRKIDKLLIRNHWKGTVTIFGAISPSCQEIVVSMLIIQLEDKPNENSLRLIDMRLEESLKGNYEIYDIGKMVMVENNDILTVKQLMEHLKTNSAAYLH